MLLRRSSRRIAGVGLLCAFFLAAGPNRAADPKADVKWETARTTEPEDLDELKALQERVKQVVEKATPSTVGLVVRVGFSVGAGSGVIVSEDGLVLTAAHVITGEDPTGKSTSYEP